ncbi:MAG: ABC transporter permease [Actinobacteria bacterium]|nr:MAG: ABC transporter permease [Actinomycetota bacterium]
MPSRTRKVSTTSSLRVGLRPRTTWLRGCRTLSCARATSGSGTAKAPSHRTSTTVGTRSGPSSPPVSVPSGAEPVRRGPRRSHRATDEGIHYSRWFWPSFTIPASIWLAILFILPLYTVISIAFGTVDPIFRGPLPVYEPWWWSGEQFGRVLGDSVSFYRIVYIHTFEYVVIASALCLVLAYAVAYYVARYGGKRKTILLALLIAPFFISYLMRMLAWINLLDTEGYINKILTFLHLVPHPIDWLSGRPSTVIMGLVYGYIPYMILPLYAFLDRIDINLLEAGRDLGAGPARTFFRVTLPLSRPGILAALVIVSLPMFGDYYTNNLLSGSPKTTMLGNLIDDALGSTGQGNKAAAFVLILMVLVLIPMLYYMRSTARSLLTR